MSCYHSRHCRSAIERALQQTFVYKKNTLHAFTLTEQDGNRPELRLPIWSVVTLVEYFPYCLCMQHPVNKSKAHRDHHTAPENQVKCHDFGLFDADDKLQWNY